MPAEVLVIHDSEAAAHELVARLTSPTWRVELAHVRDAVEHQGRLDANVAIALVDVAMTSAACDVLRALWAAQPTLEVVLCAETPEPWRGFVERSPFRPLITFLRKPFEPFEIEQLVRRYRSADHKFAVLGRLAAGIAHDLASPAQYAAMSLDAADEELRGVEDALAARDFDDARWRLASVQRLRQDATDGLTRLCALVKAVRSYSHTSRGRSKEELDVNAHLEMAAALLGAQYRQAVRIVTDLQDVPRVPGDPDAFCRAILNLAVNAAQAVEEAKRAEGVVTFRSYVAADRVVVEVQDNGTGIPEGVRDRMFDAFFTTKPREIGTGQGLTIARELIEDLHGGVLSFESQAGAGSTFRISLRLTAHERCAPRSLSATM
jgi:signal transduction histidine kinase